jgi:hypothetical protein
MAKVYSEIQERQMRIRVLQDRIKILEMDIQNYSNQRGCIFMLSLCHDKTIISEQYSMLKQSQIELQSLRQYIH